MCIDRSRPQTDLNTQLQTTESKTEIPDTEQQKPMILASNNEVTKSIEKSLFDILKSNSYNEREDPEKSNDDGFE